MKKTVLSLILKLIFLAVFNAVFFVAGGTGHNTSVWISYGFVHGAYLMLLLTPYLVRGGKSAAVFGFTLYSISYFYFAAEFLVGVLFMLVAPEGYKAAFLIQLVMAGMYGVMLVTHMIFNERTAESEEARQVQIDTIKNIAMQLKFALDRVQDKDARRKVERAYDALHSSPVKSHPELAKLERGFQTTIEAIDHAITAKNNERVASLAESLLRDINERNMRLRRL